jgi:hypothetical protein
LKLIYFHRKDVKAIFDPLIIDIERLVDEQVNGVIKKRLQEGHSKADDIKASADNRDKQYSLTHGV